jgi:hypothetical protein
MKSTISAIWFIFVFSILCCALDSPDFSGNWIRDAETSDPMSTSPDSLVVRQSNSSLDVESLWSQNSTIQGSQNEQFREIKTPFGSIVRRNTKETKIAYIPDGNEHSITDENGNSRTYRVTQSGTQLIIESFNTTNTPFGPAEIKMKEEWSLSDDGRTLIITTTTHSALGTQTQKRIYANRLRTPAAPADQKDGHKLMLQFEGVDLYEFINQIALPLGLTPIVIDPDVKGKVTLRTPSPMSKDDVLPLFHMILKNNNAALIKQGDQYRIVPIAAAVKKDVDVIE